MPEKSLLKNDYLTTFQQQQQQNQQQQKQHQQQYKNKKFSILCDIESTTPLLSETILVNENQNHNKNSKYKMDDSNATPLLGGTTKLSVESDDGTSSCVMPILTNDDCTNSIISNSSGGLISGISGKHNNTILMNNSNNINSQLLPSINSTNNGPSIITTSTGTLSTGQLSTINCNNISNNNNNINNINNNSNNCSNNIINDNIGTTNLIMNNTNSGNNNFNNNISSNNTINSLSGINNMSSSTIIGSGNSGTGGGGGVSNTVIVGGIGINNNNSNINNNSNLTGNKLLSTAPTATTTIVHFGPGGGMPPRTSLQRNFNGSNSNNIINNNNSNSRTTTAVECLLFKEPQLRRKLLILAIAFTIFGAAIGALTIYFAGGYRCLSNSANSNNAKLEQTVCLTEECVRTASSLLAAMDQSADPCVDFFQYACGTWNKKHLIPEDRGSISTFEVLADQLQVILKGVLEEYINDQDNQATIKAKMFYRSCMDIEQIRRTGDLPLKKVLRKLGGWPVVEKDWTIPNFTIEYLFGVLRGEYSEPVLIELYVSADDKNSSVNILQIDQLVLALPSRDYYLKESSENDLKAYHRYMTQIAILLGADPKTAKDELNDVLQFEINLANVSMPEADRHDTSSIYKKLTLPELQSQIPQLNWTDYLQSTLGADIKLRSDEPIVSYAMPYLVQMGKILAQTDRRIIHNYVIWRLVMSIMTHMIDDYERERVEFKKILVGIQSERVRWSQCVEWTNKKLGMAVGALFIRDNFNQESKETALEMIHTIRAAFNELLADIHWMDDETRAVAKEKADAMNERIGYPEILTDPIELEKEYVNLTIWEDHFMNNVLSILKWDAQRNLQLLRKPVDKDKWTTEPAVVNAFYNPNKNDIVFPAGILQPLFYSQHFPKSLNYGGIGVVIGHEITHGFDDKGRQFDKDGNMMQWWNNATIRAFRERAQCIIDQYSRYKIDEVGQYMNGRMTQGENIADNGGLKQAFRAFRKWVSKHGSEADLPGLNLTHDQLFFLNYAQIWCGSMRPQDALTKIRSSVHSPGFVRVLGPLSNSVDFAKAYKCPLGSPMNPTNKCSVW